MPNERMVCTRCAVISRGFTGDCQHFQTLKDFILNYGGVAPLILTTTFHEPGHKWVRSMEDCFDPNPDILYWCAWCGRHRVEVDNWKDNPECPAVVEAKKLVGVIELPPNPEVSA